MKTREELTAENEKLRHALTVWRTTFSEAAQAKIHLPIAWALRFAAAFEIGNRALGTPTIISTKTPRS